MTTDFKQLARTMFNEPIGVMKRTREEVIYDFFNYELAKQNFDPETEGKDDTLQFFDEVFKDQTLDIYKAADELDNVIEGAFDGIYCDYMYPRLNSMFNAWCKCNSLFQSKNQ